VPAGRSRGSGEIIRNPSLKSERNVRARLTALHEEVAGADQVAHYAVADPNRARGLQAVVIRPSVGTKGPSMSVKFEGKPPFCLGSLAPTVAA
jgi:hypothetical protein